MSQAPTPNEPQSLSPPAPPALESAYPVGRLNSNIVLYDGELELEQGSNHLREMGTIQFQWFPSPRITFCLRETAKQIFFTIGADAFLRLADGRTIPSACITHLPMAYREGRLSQNPSGRVESPASQATVLPFSYLMFLLPNFPDMMGEGILYSSGVWRAGRIDLHACGWRVTIDPVEHPRELREELKRQSGYIVTHVGRLERRGRLYVYRGTGQFDSGRAWLVSVLRYRTLDGAASGLWLRRQ